MRFLPTAELASSASAVDISASVGATALILLSVQLPATFLLLSRLLKGARRQQPLQAKQPTPLQSPVVSVVVPTLNEAHRIEPCLAGLSAQPDVVREILVVDSRSTDGTQAKVAAFGKKDSRIRLITDDALPDGWVGRPWALHSGFLSTDANSDWVLGVDADTQPQPGLAATLLHEAETQGYDIVSLSPRFILKSAGEWWLQPAMLMTLIYRFDSAGVVVADTERAIANGQCFLSRRKVLKELNGYTCAASSFCDDVTLVREAARRGYKVGFLDGADVISVRMYEGIAETWSGWGRSLDLKDSISQGQLWSDLWLLVSTQALPIPLLLLAWIGVKLGAWESVGSVMFVAAVMLNVLLLTIRMGMQAAVAGSYDWTQSNPFKAMFFWFAPFADPVAVLRIILSAFQRSIKWRGKTYRRI